MVGISPWISSRPARAPARTSSAPCGAPPPKCRLPSEGPLTPEPSDPGRPPSPDAPSVSASRGKDIKDSKDTKDEEVAFSPASFLDQSVNLFLDGPPEHRDPHLAGRSLIKRAAVLIEQGESESVIQALKKANGLIDPARDPRLLLCIRHNLVDNLSKMGRHTEAAALLPNLQTLAAEQGSTLDRLRLNWVAGRIAAGNAYEAALATLDLFQEAARRETATADLARQIATTLSRAEGSLPPPPLA